MRRETPESELVDNAGILKQFAAAVVYRAVEDILRWCELWQRQCRIGARAMLDAFKDAQAADSWFTEPENPDGITFVDACDAMDFHPDKFREAIYRTFPENLLLPLWHPEGSELLEDWRRRRAEHERQASARRYARQKAERFGGALAGIN